MNKPVHFCFYDENTSTYYTLRLTCTLQDFYDWLETFSYDSMETTYGIHDFCGGETPEYEEVGFSSYEISPTDFPIVMEIWRQALVTSGFLDPTQKVTIEMD